MSSKKDSVMDNGPWAVRVIDDITYHEKEVAICSDDFKHDAWLYVTGDFEDESAQVAYAEKLCKVLNSWGPF